MKIVICAVVIVLAFLIAKLRNDEYKEILRKYRELSLLSDLISRNFKTEIKSVSALCSEYFSDITNTRLEFYSTDDAISFIKNRYPFPYVTDELCVLIKECTVAHPDELEEICDKLMTTAHRNYEEMQEKYKKESGTSYIIYPGIAALLAALIV